MGRHWLRHQVLERAADSPELDDQSLLWQTLRAKHDEGSATFARVTPLSNRSSAAAAVIAPHLRSGTEASGGARRQHDQLVYCQLPRRTHISGQCLVDAAASWQEAVVVHANWLSGHTRKKSKLMRHGLWRLASDEHGGGGCAQLVPAAGGSWIRSWTVWAWAAVVYNPQVLGVAL